MFCAWLRASSARSSSRATLRTEVRVRWSIFATNGRNCAWFHIGGKTATCPTARAGPTRGQESAVRRARRIRLGRPRYWTAILPMPRPVGTPIKSTRAQDRSCQRTGQDPSRRGFLRARPVAGPSRYAAAALPARHRARQSRSTTAKSTGELPIIDRIDHIVMNCRDVKTTASWYERALGFTREAYQSPAEPEERIALKFGRQKFNLRPTGNPGWVTCRVDAPGSLDLCFITEGSPKPVLERGKGLGSAIKAGHG